MLQAFLIETVSAIDAHPERTLLAVGAGCNLSLRVPRLAIFLT